jgi:DNA-directed RNA polymerase specialized sigma24 family protein
MDRFTTFKRIQTTINYLLDEHYTYTNKEVSELLGISLSTVKRNVKLKTEDFEREFRELNEILANQTNIPH